jgi:D-methionine transport system permease protein
MFSPEKIAEALDILVTQFPLGIWETVYVTFAATFFSVVIGLPLGILLVVGEKDHVWPIPDFLLKALGFVINILRSIPFLLIVILAFPLTRLILNTTVGTVASIVPLIVAAFPFIARLVESSMRDVDPNLIEMARSLGATPFQIITKVMLKEAVPSLISNITIAITTILGYSAMGGIIGGGGLGKIAINYGYYRYRYLIMLLAVIVLVLLVQVIQMIGTAIATKSDKRLKKN